MSTSRTRNTLHYGFNIQFISFTLAKLERDLCLPRHWLERKEKSISQFCHSRRYNRGQRHTSSSRLITFSKAFSSPQMITVQNWISRRILKVTNPSRWRPGPKVSAKILIFTVRVTMSTTSAPKSEEDRGNANLIWF